MDRRRFLTGAVALAAAGAAVPVASIVQSSSDGMVWTTAMDARPAAACMKLADVIVPELFTPYAQAMVDGAAKYGPPNWAGDRMRCVMPNWGKL